MLRSITTPLVSSSSPMRWIFLKHLSYIPEAFVRPLTSLTRHTRPFRSRNALASVERNTGRAAVVICSCLSDWRDWSGGLTVRSTTSAVLQEEMAR